MRFGGKGALELAKSVVKACESESLDFRFLYSLDLPLKTKIETICKEMYGASDVIYSDLANKQLVLYDAQGFGQLPICMAKTHLSLSHDPKLKGVPTGFVIPVREVKISAGAGFITPILGDMQTMPGLPTRPCFYDIELDMVTGHVKGLF